MKTILMATAYLFFSQAFAESVTSQGQLFERDFKAKAWVDTGETCEVTVGNFEHLPEQTTEKGIFREAYRFVFSSSGIKRITFKDKSANTNVSSFNSDMENKAWKTVSFHSHAEAFLLDLINIDFEFKKPKSIKHFFEKPELVSFSVRRTKPTNGYFGGQADRWSYQCLFDGQEPEQQE